MPELPNAIRRHWHLPLNVIATLGFTVLLLVVVALLGWEAYRGAQRALLSASDETVGHVTRTLDEKLGRILEPADNQLRLLAYDDFTQPFTVEQQLRRLPQAREVLRSNPLVDAFYIAWPQGQFMLFRGLRDAQAAQRLGAPAGATLMLQIMAPDAGGTLTGHYRFYDASGRLLEARPMPDYRYDARTRPWYRLASGRHDTVIMEPYVFFTTRAIGTTMARRSTDGVVVLGLDATLASLGGELGRLRVTPSTELAIIDDSGRVLAYPDVSRIVRSDGGKDVHLVDLAHLGIPALDWARQHATAGGKPVAARAGGRDWRVVARSLTTRDHKILTVLMAIPDDELFAGARDIVRRQALIALIVLAIAIPAGWLMTRILTHPLHRLAEETRAIEAFDFKPTPVLRSRISEVDRLAVATHRMKGTISNFLDTSVALGSETELKRLLDTVLRNALEAAGAKAGAIYLLRDDGTLERARCLPEHDADRDAAPFPPVLESDQHVDHAAIRALLARHTASDGPQAAAPLLTRDGTTVGVLGLSLATPLRRGDARRGFIEALAAAGAVAIETRNLIDQQKALLESFIQLLAAAIDAKSAYTGGHCQRVPELAKMLARAAHDTQTGPLAGFHISADEWEALHIAAWLHDCGKVTTPEHIVDKATKLECIYDRIHEVRMRFEVLKRDAHIAMLAARLEGAGVGADPQLQADLEAQWRVLDDEFAFVAECNLGGEAMDPARVTRLQQIAGRTWQRTLDDRLGLSWEESRRRAATPLGPLPATEPLLADRPEHIEPRREEECLPEDNPWGFRMAVPDAKANRGELYNLSVARGTLTSEDRYIINEHIVQTIKMLDRLPFPRHLRNVPEIAGGHHERMDGKGYPKRLTRDQMSVLARVMAIADVFEALTAADRPYKRPNTLSQAIAIMARMVREQHLDAELFELFLRAGVYRAYGERFLAPEQLDQVDAEALIRQAETV